MYAFMLENLGYCPRDLSLLWINPKRKIEIIPVEYRKKEVIQMLGHYHENKK